MADGYVRERCAHGVSIGCPALGTYCEQGCRGCRISLNLRCGLHTQEQAMAIQRVWQEEPQPTASDTASDGS